MSISGGSPLITSPCNPGHWKPDSDNVLTCRAIPGCLVRRGPSAACVLYGCFPSIGDM